MRPVHYVFPDVQVNKTMVDVDPEDQSNKMSIFGNAVKEFESKCEALSNFCCQACQKTGISIKQSCYNNQICTMCYASYTNKEQLEKELPIWYDKAGAVQYNLPPQLTCLQEGEKLLIQQVAAYVPLLHLKSGQIGSRGHVCSFVQDLSSVCKILPRLPNDVHFVKVVKKYLQECGEVASKTFTVRKQVVLEALEWLKENNVEYKDIEIKETNLDWIEDSISQELPPSVIQMNDAYHAQNLPASVDLGPSEDQTLSGLQTDSPEEC